MGISRTASMAVALMLVAAACGGSDDATGLPAVTEPPVVSPIATEAPFVEPVATEAPVFQPPPTERPPIVTGEFTNPPAIVVRRGGVSIELQAWTYCWTGPENGAGETEGICADGGPPEDLQTLGGVGDIVVEFPVDFGWGGNAYEPDYSTAREVLIAVSATGAGDELPTVFRDVPAGPAVIELFGAGVGGDVIVTFRIV